MFIYLAMENQSEKQNKPAEAEIVLAPLLPKAIDDFIGGHLKRMFGAEVVDMFVAGRKRIPGVDIRIHNQPQGKTMRVTVIFMFHNKEIDRKIIFAV